MARARQQSNECSVVGVVLTKAAFAALHTSTRLYALSDTFAIKEWYAGFLFKTSAWSTIPFLKTAHFSGIPYINDDVWPALVASSLAKMRIKDSYLCYKQYKPLL